MSELLQKLVEADKVCNQANVHYEKVTRLEAEKNVFLDKHKKLVRNVIIACVLLDFFFGRFIPLSIVIISGGGVLFYKKKKNEIDRKENEFNNEINKENQLAQEIFENNLDKMGFLQIDYWYPMATEYLIKVVDNQRADNLNAALKMYDEQLHRWKVEEANQQVLQMQLAQTAHLNSIRKSSKVSAWANTANFIFNVSNNL